MKNTLSLVLIFFSLLVFSQETKEKNWTLKLNTTQLIDIFSFPTLQISAERKINPYFSVNAEIGSQLYDFGKNDTIFLKPKGFKANIEGRVYLLKLLQSRVKSKRNELYVGLQLFYRENQNTSLVEFSPINEPDKNYEDYFGMKKTAKGINLTVGYQMSITKRIIFEPFVGFGFLNRRIKNSDIEYDPTKDELVGIDLAPLFQSLNLEESSGSFFNFCSGIRLGFRL